MKYEVDKIKSEFEANLNARIKGIMLAASLAQHDISTVGGTPDDEREIYRIVAKVMLEKANYLSNEES